MIPLLCMLVSFPLLAIHKVTSSASLCTSFSCMTGCTRPPYRMCRDMTTVTSERSYRIGERVSYSCIRGCTPQGGSPISQCTSNGIWTIPTLHCKCRRQRRAIGPSYNCPCGPPPNPAPSETWNEQMNQESVSGSRICYICGRGFRHVNGSKVYRCSNYGEWTPVENNLNCTEIVCRTHLKHGYMEPTRRSTFRPGQNVTYFCEKNYRLVGDKQRRCLQSGRWSGIGPRCKEMKCRPPEPVHYGSYTPNKWSYSINDSIRYSCNIGYRRTSDSHRMCLDNRTWSGPPPLCQSVDCKEPIDSDWDFTLINGRTTYLAMALIRCHSNNQSHTVHCNRHGFWRPTIKCPKRVRCNDPEISTGCRGTDRGSNIVSSQLEGQEIFGSEMSTCQFNGSWTPKLPKCFNYSKRWLQSLLHDINQTEVIIQHGESFCVKCSDGDLGMNITCVNGTMNITGTKCPAFKELSVQSQGRQLSGSSTLVTTTLLLIFFDCLKGS